jgi:hypothetical protein
MRVARRCEKVRLILEGLPALMTPIANQQG